MGALEFEPVIYKESVSYDVELGELIAVTNYKKPAA